MIRREKRERKDEEMEKNAKRKTKTKFWCRVIVFRQVPVIEAPQGKVADQLSLALGLCVLYSTVLAIIGILRSTW